MKNVTPRGLIEGSLGKPMDGVFKSFDEKCLGAASIGQVHRATLKDGQQAVVKVPQFRSFYRLHGVGNPSRVYNVLKRSPKKVCF